MNNTRRRFSTIHVLQVFCLLVVGVCHGNPHSKAYIPYRTDPYDQAISKNNIADFRSDSSDDHRNKNKARPNMYEPEKEVEQNKECPLRFSLGVSRRSNDATPGLGDASATSSPLGIHQPPVIYPILPWQGPGRQVLYATQYEHLDMLTSAKGNVNMPSSSNDGENTGFRKFIKEGLTEHLEFPLLFESSAFQTNPLVTDVNGDGILDAILTDYHGGVYAIGLQVSDTKNSHKATNHRYFMKAQVPRMYVRRQWTEAMVNETLGIDPYEAEKAAEEAEKKLEEERKAARAAEVASGKDKDDPKEESERERRNRYRTNDERPYDPYHSYFEYSYGAGADSHEQILRGVTANVLGQDQEHIQGLEERRNRKLYPKQEENNNEKIINASDAEDKTNQHVIYDSDLDEDKNKHMMHDLEEDNANHRRLQEVDADADEAKDDDPGHPDDDAHWGAFADDLQHKDDDFDGKADQMYADDVTSGDTASDTNGDDDEVKPDGEKQKDAEGVHVEGDDDGSFVSGGDDDYPKYDDYKQPYNNYDDFYSGRYNDDHEDYFDNKHYIRLPPHILCTPVLAELPKLYSKNAGETEKLLFVAVSYYFDEDEYEGFFPYKRFKDSDHGDQTETQRGMYTANAIMVFHFGDAPRWGRQEHLDLSADHSAPVNLTMVGSIPLREDNSKLGAFALSSPTVADINGDGSVEILMGTSMGFLYVMDARSLYSRTNFPIQLEFGIESRILVEDVRGDTNLEIFVADVGGNVICLDDTGKKLWHRNLLYSVTDNQQIKGKSEVIGSSQMVLGDVNGDGILDIVILLQIKTSGQGLSNFLFALSADNGKDIQEGGFPINVWTKNNNYHHDNVGEDFVHVKLPPPLLVDMHEDQDHIADYLKRNGTRWSKPKAKSESHRDDNSKVPHGGTAGGLHIVQPIDTFLVIVEGGSGCTQSIEIGEEINSMVQADDVHGSNKLDLVISTATGNVVTLESEAPFHPLNVWNNGELRSRTNGAAHGYSASQGIFVHEISRRFRDIFGVYVPVTFEIFDNRPNIQNEPDKRKYDVEIRTGTTNLLYLKSFGSPGIYTEHLYIPSGPGHYTLSVILKTTHGLTYEDAFHIGYNVNYMDGFSILLWLPLTIATICIFLMVAKKGQSWEDEDYEGSSGKGILDSYAGLPE